MQDAELEFLASSFPEGTCFASEQERLMAIARNLRGILPGQYSTIIFDADEPAPEDRDKLWFKLSGDGSPDRLYAFYNGAWVSKHPTPPGPNGEIKAFEGDSSLIPTYDGGEAGEVGEASGPMWALAEEYQARFPIGAGTLASGTAIAVGATGGEEKVTTKLVAANIPAHSHNIGVEGSDTTQEQDTAGKLRTGGGDIRWLVNATKKVGQTEATGSGEAFVHNNLPPYRVVHWIRRTARKYYRAT
jgi:microcystin-dependent protein